MEKRTIPSVIVSTDAEFRATLHQALRESGSGVVVAGEVEAPPSRIGADEIARIREAAPQLIFLDLDSDPAVGIRFAQFLADADPHRRFIAAGPELGPEVLLDAMRAGISEYLPKPVTREAVTAALERVGRKLAGSGSNGPRAPGEITAVFSAKGGSGSTTVATNLAVYLQQLTGKKTLLLDLDLELGEVAAHLGVQPRFSFVDLIRNFHRMDAELLASYIEKHSSGIHYLSAPFHPETGEAVTAEGIRRILHLLRQHYDHLVVDTSKSFSATTLATFEQADRILLVTTVDLPSLRNIKRCMPLLERVAGSTAEKVHLVVNRYDPRDPISLDEVKQALGRDVAWTLANDYEAVSRSINAGEPAVLSARGAFTHDLMAMGGEIGGLAPKRNGKKRGLFAFRRLFARNKEALAHG